MDIPKPAYKFTFGLWTVSHLGRDPFGGAVRELKSPAELIRLLADLGAGAWKDIPSVCNAVVKITSSMLPDPAQIEVYHKAYPSFCQLYPALKPSFKQVV